MKRNLSVWLSLVLALAAVPALAQENKPTGKIHGKVTNPVGVPQGSGTISLSNGPGEDKATFTVDANGEYSGEAPAGSYTLIFRQTDTPKDKQVDRIDNVKIVAGQDTQVDDDMSRPEFVKTLPADVQKQLAPGVRQTDLSAKLVRRAFELGATANMLEAIWQVMPPSRAEGVWTTHGDLALPLLTAERELAEGDVLWTDVSISYAGYCSDFGRTWLVGDEPSARQQAQFDQWRHILDAVLKVTKAGATSGDLARAAIAANGGSKPWLPHFYLGHGIGTYPAEPPMIGTDLGEEYDDNFVFPAGMVLVLEPVVWEDGTGGYRSEEIVVITDEGCIRLTDYPYTPYGH